MLTNDELMAIEERIAAVQHHIDVSREEFGRVEWWREDAPPIQITKAATDLLAEVKRLRSIRNGVGSVPSFQGFRMIALALDQACEMSGQRFRWSQKDDVIHIQTENKRRWHSPDNFTAHEVLLARAGVEAIVEDEFRHRAWALVSWIESEQRWKVWHHRPEDAPSSDLKVIAWREFERIEDQVLP